MYTVLPIKQQKKGSHFIVNESVILCFGVYDEVTHLIDTPLYHVNAYIFNKKKRLSRLESAHSNASSVTAACVAILFYYYRFYRNEIGNSLFQYFCNCIFFCLYTRAQSRAKDVSRAIEYLCKYYSVYSFRSFDAIDKKRPPDYETSSLKHHSFFVQLKINVTLPRLNLRPPCLGRVCLDKPARQRTSDTSRFTRH